MVDYSAPVGAPIITNPVEDNLDGTSKKMVEMKRKLMQIAEQATNEDHAIVADFLRTKAGSRRMKITPSAAAIIVLYHNPINRKLSLAKIEHLTGVIDDGDWRGQHHQGAASTPDGKLGDGQHRLIACALSGEDIEMLVTSDVSFDDILDVVDQMTPRLPGQALKMRGWEEGEETAPLADKLAQYVHQREHGIKPKLSGIKVQRFAEANRPILNSAVEIGAKSRDNVTKPCLTKGEASLVAAICMFDGWGHPQAAGFIALVQQGIAPYDKCPILVLDKKLSKSNDAAGSKEILPTLTRIALTIKCAGMYAKKQASDRLDFDLKKEGLPTVRLDPPEMQTAAD
jgi:hypothetical protein